MAKAAQRLIYLTVSGNFYNIISKYILFKDHIMANRAVREVVGLVVALLIALSIRSFLYQPFVIPTGSMYPTLMIGDFPVVNKFIYGYGRCSFPFHLPIFKGRIFEGQPKQGDVVVFTYPIEQEFDFIKRCIGLPGDRVQMIDGYLYINGEKVKVEEAGTYTLTNQLGRTEVHKRYKETLPGGKEHYILKKHDFGKARLDNTQEFVVPEGHYFMMGDNRDNSADGREWGFVPAELLIGRADILMFSTDAKLFIHPESKWWELWDLDFIAWIPGIRWSRVFNLIN
jgi:signal peptidase I